MKKFLLKCFVFFAVFSSIFILLLSRYGGYMDYFYSKFTSPPAGSMIIGDSRSFQGIQPQVLNDKLKSKNVPETLNYSFTIAQIAYGKPYTESIMRKLDPEVKNGVFILVVHPWTLSERPEKDDLDNNIYFESNLPPHNMTWVNMNPNLEYIYKNLQYFHFRGIFRKSSKTHDDGWLEETNLPEDPQILDFWTQKQLELYSNFGKTWKPSDIRISDLVDLIQRLNKHGEVFLVRMPVAPSVLSIERNYWSDFDQKMYDIAKRTDNRYISFSEVPENICVYDGVHIDKWSGKQFTEILSDSILPYIPSKKSIYASH